MWVLSKQRITIFAAIKISGKGGNDPHSCPWNLKCDNYVSSGSSYANCPTAWCTILPDNSQSLMWVRFPRHLRKARKHYRITAARLWSLSCARQIQLMSSHPTPQRSIPLSHQSHGLPRGLFLQVYYVLYSSPACCIPSQCFSTSFSYIQINNWTLEGKLPIGNFRNSRHSNVYMKQSAQLRQWHKS